MRHSITPIFEQIFFFGLDLPVKRRSEGICSTGESQRNLYFGQHRVVLPNVAGQTMLHCERNNKSAAPADNDTGLNHRVERSEQCKQHVKKKKKITKCGKRRQGSAAAR